MLRLYSRLLAPVLLVFVALACASAASAAIITTPCSYPCRVGSTASVWNDPIIASAPLDPDSANMIADLNTLVASEEKAASGPWIGVGDEILLASPTDPTVPVTITCACGNTAALRADMQAVPIPASGFLTTLDSDHEMAVWQPSTDKMWEFYHFQQNADGSYQAGWGGYMAHVSQQVGYYSWLDGTADFGDTASGLPYANGIITIWDLGHGYINHALALNVPFARSGVYSTPAQRDDGENADPESLPEGARLRIDPSVDLSTLMAGDPPLVQEMAAAAQRYGIIVRDQTGGGLSFLAQDLTAWGFPNYYYTNLTPNTPQESGPFDGMWPSGLMRYFPWQDLQVVHLQCLPTACA